MRASKIKKRRGRVIGDAVARQLLLEEDGKTGKSRGKKVRVPRSAALCSLAVSGKPTGQYWEIQQLLGHQRTTTTDAYLKSLFSGIGQLAGVIETAVLPKQPQPPEPYKTRHDGDDEVLKNVQ